MVLEVVVVVVALTFGLVLGCLVTDSTHVHVLHGDLTDSVVAARGLAGLQHGSDVVAVGHAIVGDHGTDHRALRQAVFLVHAGAEGGSGGSTGGDGSGCLKMMSHT